MIKFKIGDRVRFVGKPIEYSFLRISIEKGDVGTVKEESLVPYIALDKCPDKDIAISQENLELVPVNRTFKVGDIVRIVRKTGHAYANFPFGIKAKVIAEKESGSCWDYIVQLTGEGATGWTHDHIYRNCQNVKAADLELVKEKFKLNIVIYRKDNKVIAQLHNGKCIYASAEAKCSPNDTFNFAVGSQIALQRLCRKMGTDGSSAIVIPEDLKLNELFMY